MTKIEQECKAFCENVKLLRMQNNLSQKEMAHIMKISVESVRKIENGDLPICVTTNVLFYLACRFQVRISDLFRPLKSEEETT